nr:hypothetical protein [Nanoarchaeota archaeon]
MEKDNESLEEKIREDNEKIKLLVSKLNKLKYITVIMSFGGDYSSDDPEKHEAHIIYEFKKGKEGCESDLKSLEEELSSNVEDYTSEAYVIVREDELLGIKTDKKKGSEIMEIRKIIIRPFENIGDASYKRKLTDKIIRKMVKGVDAYTQKNPDSKSDTTLSLPAITDKKIKE